MSVSTPTLTTPSEICAAAGPAAQRASARVRAAASAAVGAAAEGAVEARFRLVRAMGPPFDEGLSTASDAKESMERLLAPLQSGSRDNIDDAAVLDQVVAIRERRDEAEVLLDQDHGEALLLERPHDASERLDDHRREALGDLVEQQQARAGAEDAGHGEHLLLAAGEARPLAPPPLEEIREHGVDRLVAHAARADLRQQGQVLLGREAGEDAALLGTVADAEADDAVRRQSDRLAAVHHDRARAARDEAEDGLERGRPPRPVAAEQRHDLPLPHLEVEPVQDVRLAVERVQVGHPQQLVMRREGAGHGSAPSAASTPI